MSSSASRLFQHLLRLPIGYFETRSAGQTVARVRELETIRTFLTGQGLFAALDFLFVFIFIAVLFAYSVTLTLIVLGTIPLYLLLTWVVRPLLRDRIQEKFRQGRAQPAIPGRDGHRHRDGEGLGRPSR